jgi:hypothetical protein
MNLRLSFVQAVESPAPSGAEKATARETPSEASKPAEPPHATESNEPAAGQEDEHRKKFSKKY